MRHTLRIVSASLAAALTVPAMLLPASAAAQGDNFAGLVVDTGEEVKTVCVRFAEESITGDELLRRSGLEVETAQFASGTAVCSICEVGCDASDCFCDSQRYWNYSTASDGDEGWSRASRGASHRTVTHGSLDGWAWGDGVAPPFIEFQTICSAELAAGEASPSPAETSEPEPTAEPSPTTDPGPTPAPTSEASDEPSVSDRADEPGEGSFSPTTPEPADPAASPDSTDAQGTDEAGQTATPDPDDDDSPEAASVPDEDRRNAGGSTLGLVIVAAVLALLGAGILAARRREG